MNGCDWVFHLQANADVRWGLEDPRRDLEQNTIATSNVLEAMRANGVSRIAFASTGSIYGEPVVFPTPEDAPFPLQTSLYGASKLACEGLIEAYVAGYGFTGLIFRFVSILGERYTHGHVFDFYRALKLDPAHLQVLGDGRQEKSYLYVKDCLEAMLTAAGRHEHGGGALIYNLGTDETLTVDESIATITEHLDTARVRELGWEPRVTIREAVVRTLDWLGENEYAWREAPAQNTLEGAAKDNPEGRAGRRPMSARVSP
jgi:UDP-glucose 4-epimerase